MTRTTLVAVCLVSCSLLAACQPQDRGRTHDGSPRVVAASDIEAGRYIVMTSGCNDCHTPLYARTGGAQPPESEWLKGSSEPHTGPWGASYGKNLRLTAASRSEDAWVALLDTGTSLPPMPWPSVRNMSDADKRAIYRYIKALPGDLGDPAPDPAPPAAMPTNPPSG
jgi:mono/diheme cytochrome c family protein